jgi:hypothetical protein
MQTTSYCKTTENFLYPGFIGVKILLPLTTKSIGYSRLQLNLRAMHRTIGHSNVYGLRLEFTMQSMWRLVLPGSCWRLGKKPEARRARVPMTPLFNAKSVASHGGGGDDREYRGAILSTPSRPQSHFWRRSGGPGSAGGLSYGRVTEQSPVR